MIRHNVIDSPPEPSYPHFDLVPGNLSENIEFRKAIRIRAANDEEYQQQMIQKCREDSLFWLSAFCMLFEPRPTPRLMPFIPWPHQIPVWVTTEQYLGYGDIGWEKSRGEGASWMACMLLLHRWLFTKMFAAGIVSKDEASVDSPDNPDSMFWKLVWQISKMPFWMTPKYTRTMRQHTIHNEDNGSTITGFAATPNVGSGGRKTVFVLDELAKFPRGGKPPADHACMDSVQHVTDSRLLISTPFGPDGAYYRAMHENSDIVKLRLHWSQNPTRIQGAYRVHISRSNRRTVELVDLDFWLQRARDNGHPESTKADLPGLARQIRAESVPNPFSYRFMMDGDFVRGEELRSVWYDTQCRRPGATARSIAQELDLDYGGSASRFFNVELLNRIQREYCRPPTCRCEILYDMNAETHTQLSKPTIRRNDSGRLLLWFEPDMFNRPPQNRNYVLGVDIAAGTGGVLSSNSSVTIMDRELGKQVGELTTPYILPTDMAAICVALCYYFAGKSGPAMLIWEVNGPPGAQFGKRIVELEYNNVYMRGSDSGETFYRGYSKKIGWRSDKNSKPIVLGEFARALDSGDCTIRSRDTIEEAKFYMNKIGGTIEHASASTEEDPSGAGERHGDRVIGAALAWWGCREYRKLPGNEQADVNPHTFEGRRRESRKEQRKEKKVLWVPRSQQRNNQLGRSHDNPIWRI